MAKAIKQPAKPSKNVVKDKVAKKKNSIKSNTIAPKRANHVRNVLKKEEAPANYVRIVPKQKGAVNKRTLGTLPKTAKHPKKSGSKNTKHLKAEITTEEYEDEMAPRCFVTIPELIDRKQIRSGVDVLFEYLEKKESKQPKTKLFADDAEPIFLQITAIKVPNTPNRQVRWNLQHSLLANGGDVCLIVRDVGKAKEHEETIEHFEELLNRKGVKGITTIMPFHQFRTEYANQYELKRKLVGLYDHFLVDARVGGYVAHLLGKIFLEKRKMPTPINLEKNDLKDHIGRSLKKSIMKMHSKGDSYQVQVGHFRMSQEQVYENVVAVVNALDEKFPGSIENVRALGVRPTSGLTIPIYLTLKNKSSVKVPLTLPKLPKAYREESGELTTFQNRDITVLPSGEVIVHDRPDSDLEVLDADEELLMVSDTEDLPIKSDNEFEDESLPEDVKVKETKEKLVETEGKRNKKVQGKKNKIKEQANIKEETQEEENGVEDVLAQAEESYLNEYEQEQIGTRKERNSKKKEISTKDKVQKLKKKRQINKPANQVKKIVQPKKKNKTNQQQNSTDSNAQLNKPANQVKKIVQPKKKNKTNQQQNSTDSNAQEHTAKAVSNKKKNKVEDSSSNVSAGKNNIKVSVVSNAPPTLKIKKKGSEKNVKQKTLSPVQSKTALKGKKGKEKAQVVENGVKVKTQKRKIGPNINDEVSQNKIKKLDKSNQIESSKMKTKDKQSEKKLKTPGKKSNDKKSKKILKVKIKAPSLKSK